MDSRTFWVNVYDAYAYICRFGSCQSIFGLFLAHFKSNLGPFQSREGQFSPFLVNLWFSSYELLVSEWSIKSIQSPFQSFLDHISSIFSVIGSAFQEYHTRQNLHQVILICIFDGFSAVAHTELNAPFSLQVRAAHKPTWLHPHHEGFGLFF